MARIRELINSGDFQYWHQRDYDFKDAENIVNQNFV